MTSHQRLRARHGGLPLLALALSGCAGMNLGSLSDILASGMGFPGMGGNLSGEIRSIDTRRQEIELSSGWGGGAERIRYDNRTEVLYDQRRYDIRDLERGDYVQVQLDDNSDSRNDRDRRLARTIHVQQSTASRDPRDTSSDSRRIERIDGSIVRLDQRQGWFEIEDRYGDVITVTLPYQANRGLSDRFERLRRGERVRIEGERLNAGRMEVHRFL